MIILFYYYSGTIVWIAIKARQKKILLLEFINTTHALWNINTKHVKTKYLIYKIICENTPVQSNSKSVFRTSTTLSFHRFSPKYLWFIYACVHIQTRFLLSRNGIASSDETFRVPALNNKTFAYDRIDGNFRRKNLKRRRQQCRRCVRRWTVGNSF